MRRNKIIIGGVLLFSLVMTLVESAPLNRSYVPTVYGAQPQLGLVTLRETDTTFIGVTYDASTGRVFVAFVDRANGNRVHETELVGDVLQEISLPALQSTDAIVPSFVAPDSNKDADVDQFIANGVIWLFFTSRDACTECAGKPFKLKLLRFRP